MRLTESRDGQSTTRGPNPARGAVFRQMLVQVKNEILCRLPKRWTQKAQKLLIMPKDEGKILPIQFLSMTTKNVAHIQSGHK